MYSVACLHSETNDSNNKSDGRRNSVIFLLSTCTTWRYDIMNVDSVVNVYCKRLGQPLKIVQKV